MTYVPGDILLVNDYEGSTDWLGGLIRAGERARGDDAGDDVWTHSALIVTADGDLIEALERGVKRSPISKYAKVQTRVVSPDVPADDPRRLYAVARALSCEGDAYGVLDFVSLGFSLLLRNRWSTHIDGEPICSELVARATESMTQDGYPYAPERMMPGDLGAYWDGRAPLKPLGFWRKLLILFGVTFKAMFGRL